jgi:hypothetical protein
MPDADRRLREVAQLRKLWRAFRDPQERLQDERLSGAIIHDRAGFLRVREPMALYGRDAIRSAVRRWWCAGEYAAIVEIGERAEPKLFDEEPIIWIYVKEAKARMAIRWTGSSGTNRPPDQPVPPR